MDREKGKKNMSFDGNFNNHNLTTLVPLNLLPKGKEGVITSIKTTDRLMLRKIMAMGAFPGLVIKTIQRFPAYVFQIGESQFAIDQSIAELIHVQL
jgi:Fe2+ transport system protein FeoA